MSPTSVNLFDAEDLIFRMMGQEDLARVVAASFLEDAPLQLTALVRAAEMGDLTAVQSAAHALKGASGNVGSPRVYRLSSRIEAFAGEGRVPRELLPELCGAIAALHAVVSAFIAG